MGFLYGILYFFFLLPRSSNSSSLSSLGGVLYSTVPRSSKPPPRPVRSSSTVNWGPLHTLQVDLRAQLTLPHLLHCQSSAEKRPLLFSAAFEPILMPPLGPLLSMGLSTPHRLQLVLRAKLTLPHAGSGQGQSPSEGVYPPPRPRPPSPRPRPRPPPPRCSPR